MAYGSRSFCAWKIYFPGGTESPAWARRLLILVYLPAPSPREAAAAPSRGTTVANGLTFSVEEGPAGSCSPLAPPAPAGLVLTMYLE